MSLLFAARGVEVWSAKKFNDRKSFSYEYAYMTSGKRLKVGSASFIVYCFIVLDFFFSMCIYNFSKDINSFLRGLPSVAAEVSVTILQWLLPALPGPMREEPAPPFLLGKKSSVHDTLRVGHTSYKQHAPPN